MDAGSLVLDGPFDSDTKVDLPVPHRTRVVTRTCEFGSYTELHALFLYYPSHFVHVEKEAVWFQTIHPSTHKHARAVAFRGVLVVSFFVVFRLLFGSFSFQAGAIPFSRSSFTTCLCLTRVNRSIFFFSSACSLLRAAIRRSQHFPPSCHFPPLHGLHAREREVSGGEERAEGGEAHHRRTQWHAPPDTPQSAPDAPGWEGRARGHPSGADTPRVQTHCECTQEGKGKGTPDSKGRRLGLEGMEDGFPREERVLEATHVRRREEVETEDVEGKKRGKGDIGRNQPKETRRGTRETRREEVETEDVEGTRTRGMVPPLAEGNERCKANPL
eukprot:scaffold24_cov341-Pavlova_lutheri.AAC.110